MDFFPKASTLNNGTEQPEYTTVKKLMADRKMSVGHTNPLN
jgi:hypothetical protein